MGDAGTVTVMFTDLAGSTALSDLLGDVEAQALRRAHDRILREQFERSGGRVVKGTGDGFMVAFESARRGVECAAAIQRRLAAEHAEGRYSQLRVRIGLHTGEPTEEGGDLFGSDVNLAARIEAEAAAGQILVSQVTSLLARDSRGVEFAHLGERTLKGFAAAVPLFEARWSGEGRQRLLSRFVGRAEEMATLRAGLEAAIGGEGRLILVSGEPGVGKTRLVSELALYAADRGMRVLRGRAYETEGAPAYLPFTGPLSKYISSCSIDELKSQLDGNAPYLAKLVPELRLRLPDIAEPQPLDAEGERYRLFEAASHFLLAMAARTPLLLFLDDLHWADTGTLLLLHHLSRRLAEGPLLTICTYRGMEVEAPHPLVELLAEMPRQKLGQVIGLRPFGREEAALLVEGVAGSPAAVKAVDTIFAATEGNPFFIEEVVRHQAEQGRELADPKIMAAGWAIPAAVEQVIEKRLARLGDEAARVLAYSSVLGRDLSLLKVGVVTEKEEGALLDLLDEALAAHVLRAEGDGYAFAHPLFQAMLYGSLTVPRRRQLHRRVGEALEALYGDEVESHLSELAHHFLQTARDADASASRQLVDKAVDYAARAAARAMAQLAYEDAVRLYQMAIEVLPRLSNDARRCDLLLAVAAAQAKAGDWEGADGTFFSAAAAARTLNDSKRLAQAALGNFWEVQWGNVNQETVALLEEALAALDERDHATRAMLLSRLGYRLTYADSDRAAYLTRHAVEEARRSHDDRTVALALNERHAVLQMLGVPEGLRERQGIVRELIQLAERLGDKSMLFYAYATEMAEAAELGDMQASDRARQARDKLAEELELPHELWFSASDRADEALYRGRFEEAERLIQQGFDAAGRTTGAEAAEARVIQRLLLRRERGELDGIEGEVRDGLSRYPAVAASAAGAIDCDLCRSEMARSTLDRLGENSFAELPRDGYWQLAVVLLCDVCAYLKDAQHAEKLYDLVRPRCGRNLNCPPAFLGSACRYLGVLAATMERWPEAEAHFQHALHMNARTGARMYLAHTQYEYGQMLWTRDKPEDRKQAAGLASEALAMARELRMKSLESRAKALHAELMADS